jgi:hypothetical protein
MTLSLDEAALCRELAPLLDDPEFRRGVTNLAADPFFVAFFLASVSQGEGLGEHAVALIGQEELARRIQDLKRQELEERGHKEQTLAAAVELFPEHFENGVYRHAAALQGATYYVAVLEENRQRLKRLGRYSRLNLYMTTTFAYEVMVMLLYRAVADAIARSDLAPAVRTRVVSVIERILGEEETHLGVVDQHNALLDAARGSLSGEAAAMLDALAELEVEDYRFPAERAVRQVVATTRRYADAAGYRAEIEAAGTGA